MIRIQTDKQIDHIIRDGKGRILEDSAAQRRKITISHVARIMDNAGGRLAWAMNPCAEYEDVRAQVSELECWMIQGKPLIVQYRPNGGAELYESMEETDWPSIGVRIAKMNKSLEVTDQDLFRTPQDMIARVAARLAKPMTEQDRVNNAASLRDALEQL